MQVHKWGAEIYWDKKELLEEVFSFLPLQVKKDLSPSIQIFPNNLSLPPSLSLSLSLSLPLSIR